MYIDVNRLKCKIAANGTTQDAIADAINIDRSTFYRKIKSGGYSFSIKKIQGMVVAIPLTTEEAIDIFLSVNSHCCDCLDKDPSPAADQASA